MSAVRAAETRAEQLPVDEKEAIREDEIETVNEREQLYVDVLYTIANCVGCQQQGGQVSFPKLFHDMLFRRLIDSLSSQSISLSLFSLLTLRTKCIQQHSVRLASHPIDIIDCCMQLSRKNPKSLSYR